MAENGGYAKPVLVTSGWLADHLGDAGVVVAEVDENPDLYDEGHIPGAVKLHWKLDLQDPIERDIVDKATFERVLGERGIGNDTTVVLYGDKNNWFAAYAYWYLKVYGHGDVRILDGGRQKWIDEGRALTTDAPSPAAKSYSAKERDESIRAYRDQVREWLGKSDRALVDVRSPGEYAGDLIAPPGYEQEGAQRAGHIPTAASIPWASAVTTAPNAAPTTTATARSTTFPRMRNALDSWSIRPSLSQNGRGPGFEPGPRCPSGES